MRSWRTISGRQWAWTAAIATVLLLANMAGLLPPLLNAVPVVSGSAHTIGIESFVGGSLLVFATAVCFLLAISIAEGSGTQTRVRPYAVAGAAAWGAAILLEIGLYVLVPGTSPSKGGVALLLDGQHLLGRIVWAATNIGLSGGLALAVYVRFQSARQARRAFNAVELERVAARREVLASRLAAMQAQVEPQFLLGTLAQVESLYARDPVEGNRMLDGLIDYLHAALPQLRSQHSTLAQEVRLAESYMRIVQIRMGSRLDYRIDMPSELDDCEFPPMVVLPLIDDALRNGLESLTLGGTITLSAEATGARICVRIADNGLPRASGAIDAPAMVRLRERLDGLYGPAASLEVSDRAQGTVSTVEVPLGPARDHR